MAARYNYKHEEFPASDPAIPKDIFKEHFKYYKKRKPPPDLSRVVDFYNFNNSEIFQVNLETPDITAVAGLTPVSTWAAYGHKHFPGFVFIKNPFQAGFQRYWIYRCLHDYPSKPSVSNLDAHFELGMQDNIWDMSHRENNTTTEKSFLDRLRWVTLGYHHNWDTKVYSSHGKTMIPDDLTYMASYIAAALGHHTYRAEAAIVNYYHLDSTLGGHTDNSEYDEESPLISFSFGQTAIFLMGGLTKQDEPVAAYLRSGDISIMMGPGRLAYHAIPKILTPEDSALPDCLSDDICRLTANTKLDNEPADCVCSKSDGVSSDAGSQADLNALYVNHHIIETLKSLDWSKYGDYIRTARVNMNVRQVLKPGQTFPSEAKTSGSL